MKVKLTKLQKDILEYIKTNGSVSVELSPTILKQNKNFYYRIKRLEQEGFILIDRRDGLSSLYTITNLGLEGLGIVESSKKKMVGFPGIVSEWDSPSPIQRMRNEIYLSDLDKDTKDRLIKALC